MIEMTKQPTWRDIFPLQCNSLAYDLYQKQRLKTPFVGPLWTRAEGEFVDENIISAVIFNDYTEVERVTFDVTDNDAAKAYIKQRIRTYAEELIRLEKRKKYEKKVNDKVKTLMQNDG